MLKKSITLLLALCMLLSLVACSANKAPTTAADAQTPSAEATGDAGTYVMINKIYDDYLLKNYAGFESYLKDHGITAEEKSASTYGVSEQVEVIDEMIAHGVSAISVNACGETGFDEVLRKARNAGIAVNSFDAALNPDLRTVNVNQASNADVGAYFVRLSVLAALRLEYSGDDMVSTLEQALAAYDGEEIMIGCLTASIDAPVQNAWIQGMRNELAKDMYAGKVNREMDVKYGNDDATVSTTQAQAYLAEDKVDVIVCISTVAMIAAAQVVKDAGSDMKVTGCGAPSQIQSFMPKEGEDTFSTPVPYIVLWDLTRVGAVAACALMAEKAGTFDGSIGSTLEMDAWNGYEATIFTVTEAADGGPEIVVGQPLVFDKNNVADWIDIL